MTSFICRHWIYHHSGLKHIAITYNNNILYKGNKKIIIIILTVPFFFALDEDTEIFDLVTSI